jgi:hypothetical protein
MLPKKEEKKICGENTPIPSSYSLFDQPKTGLKN